ncbi:MAG TPA: hypothetical protein VD866_06330, partial [Urbifossiella sp.]|nr:hypothetical protein [Urbifossiella sp.]
MGKERIVNGRVEAIVYPTKERNAKGDVRQITTDRGGREVRAYARDVLGYYLKRDHITPPQMRAGRRLERVYREGCTTLGYVQFQYRESSGGTREMNPDPPGASGKTFRDAMAAVRGRKEKKIAFDVCCYD